MFKKILPEHPADPSHVNKTLAVDPLGRIPFLFGGLVHKRISKLPRGVVDMYAVLMASHFFSGEEHGLFLKEDFKWSLQKRYMEGGRAPMPILTCIRHERPWLARIDSNAPEEYRIRQQKAYEANDDDDDLGKKQEAVSSLIGSAMTAPFQTSVETLERSDPKSWVGKKIRESAMKLIAPGTSLNVKEMLANHPFHSAYNWNPMYRILPAPQPPGLVNSPRIQLVDAGADNNQPLYPFTRPGRGIDIIFDFDSSEDVERNIVTPDIEIFGKRKGLNWARVTPTPPTFPPDDKQTPLDIKYKDRYCQVFAGTPVDDPDGAGAHGEPLADRP
ncbi:hypothetical protein HK405_015173, partial [Cladochytrium tenue]